MRHKTKEIFIGNVGIGGNNPIRIQSMTNTDTRDVNSTVEQIKRLENVGCEIVRVAVLDEQAAKSISKIKNKINIPLVADIHFDYRLALISIKEGVDGLRINPGNIGSEDKVDLVVREALEYNVPIRIGVNGGSLEKDLLLKYNGVTPEAMVESALKHVRMLEQRDFFDIKISLKCSSVLKTIKAYQLLAKKVYYPLHIGITEAGTFMRGTVKSSVGLGILLFNGLGDTLRVSLTDDPVKEVQVAWEILRSLELRQRGPEIISCPTCGRTEIDLIALANKVEDALKDIQDVFSVAVMGCVVNGPGEAKDADIGLAGGRDCGVIFVKGKIKKKIKGEKNLLSAFLEEVDSFLKSKKGGDNVK
ncbi:4-hydroxy-3-methylbut-2-en-1-yl diphosphate synthase [Desulfonauticus submarinus]|uniref:4-hydroxy-3-methylbut-2-en-1-yl diphosphate synthase (flavodoxin) n=1 Tax=Desulfonauticus submarinus TaxID=206665 RepID=A0A1H0ANG6_9BACT|nr:flavodoxin-dependent (E)-4-hydroxy-3-methylbut-2-enyl-diphosphate synthase [Desulfonauticus submarinus]SDN34436.1 4-hydroxy-3-methylbut-2-en-1-yl diphosphate synthase [Desulfonauticus submarinus]